MATPHSPDKPLVSSTAGKAEPDNTGWVIALIKEQKDFLLALIEANDLRYDQRFEASKEAITAALSAAKEAITAALLAADRAVAKAEGASEKRFEAVNEFRATLSDQQRTLMPRPEAEILIKSLQGRIDVLESRVIEVTSKREGAGEGWKMALGAVGLIATILSITAVIITLMRN